MDKGQTSPDVKRCYEQCCWSGPWAGQCLKVCSRAKGHTGEVSTAHWCKEHVTGAKRFGSPLAEEIRQPLFTSPMTTLFAAAEARRRVMMKVEAQQMSTKVGAVLRGMLIDVERHIQQYGAPGKTVAICGSNRFIELMAVAAWEEEKKGHIALGGHMLPSWYTDGPYHLAERQGDLLNKIHLSKIRMADEILVIDAVGYVGESTEAEISLAGSLGKPVRRISEELPDWLTGMGGEYGAWSMGLAMERAGS
jgi:hypothetical protein